MNDIKKIRHKVYKNKNSYTKTSRHNGKVKRQHRQDSQRFYKYLKMFNLEDVRKQLAKYQAKSNNYIKTCLGFKSPNLVVEQYLGVF